MEPERKDAVEAKRLVQQSYDRCAAVYSEARQRDAFPELSLASDRLHDGARVLDIGCGAGVPVARALATRFVVTGVDISGEQIRLARENVPTATFLHSDIMAATFPPAHFDAIVSFYAIFHLPPEEQPELIQRIATWLAPGGYLLATVAQDAEPGYTEDDFFGVTMYWSHHSLADYKAMLEANGLTVLESTIISHGYEDQAEATERHPLVFARKQGQLAVGSRQLAVR